MSQITPVPPASFSYAFEARSATLVWGPALGIPSGLVLVFWFDRRFTAMPWWLVGGIVALWVTSVILRARARLAEARAQARELGRVSVDDDEVHWQSVDGTSLLRLRWSSVEFARIDLKNKAIVLRSAGHLHSLYVAAGRDQPSRILVLERFDELAASMQQKVVIEPARGDGDSTIGRRLISIGVVVVLLAALQFRCKQALSAHLSEPHAIWPGPLCLAILGTAILLGSFPFNAGNGPAVSPLRSPNYPWRVARIVAMVVALDWAWFVLLNGGLTWLRNL